MSSCLVSFNIERRRVGFSADPEEEVVIQVPVKLDVHHLKKNEEFEKHLCQTPCIAGHLSSPTASVQNKSDYISSSLQL
ncbi:hypothetical protein scyTo_0009672 [Scyliorhinus torazame]|uniref:Uncharacterized protein n=1 Tax=Scyliorhinus torazame TaxID=75743 RepID=A0A401NRF7_SCYTO|nr:hypothetical protein [Scyliorhinus torazame]